MISLIRNIFRPVITDRDAYNWAKTEFKNDAEWAYREITTHGRIREECHR